MKIYKKISSVKTTIGLLLVLAVLIFIYVLLHFSSFSEYLYGAENLGSRGKLLSTLLTAMGGCAVVYGLYLNNRRIKEQTRQNDNIEKNNNDKRFGDAIGYLNSDNIGIAIGGANALYQLAKEDKRYVSTVSSMLVNYIKYKSQAFYTNKESKESPLEPVQIVVDLLFNEENLFIEEKKDFMGADFVDIRFNGNVENTKFGLCSLRRCTFEKEIKNCMFYTMSLSSCYFNSSSSDSRFFFTSFNFCHFLNEKNKKPILDNCLFSAGGSKDLRFKGSEINNSRFVFNGLKECVFDVLSIRNSYFVTERIGRIEESENIVFNQSTFENTTFEDVEGMSFSDCKNAPLC